VSGNTIGTGGSWQGDAEPAGAGALLYHGGNLAVARRIWPAAPEPWIDLSTGINPVPYPAGDLPATVWTRLPEAAEVKALERAAAEAWGTEPGAVVAAPGTQALLQLLPRLIPAKRVAILDFTYAEHARTWERISGARVETVTRPERLAEADVAVVVNPNNPDGRVVPASDLAALARGLRRRGGWLVVDEAFGDVLAPAASLMGEAPSCGAIVLRSFGKTYGLAGVRLGFLVAPAALANRVRDALGPWAVSGPAIALGRQALSDGGWLAETIARLSRDAARLDAMLVQAGLTAVGGTPLFRLAASPRAGEIFERLAGAGVLVRAFSARPDWLRIGLPAPDRWDLLQERLGAIAPVSPGIPSRG
jgi:cobalamin biosynthetic protein CobC